MEELYVVSLFDGMSCGQIALNELGIKNYKYFASEIDKAAIKVTQDNYPNTIQLGDVTKIMWSDYPPIYLLIAGSPCQDFSLAGKQDGMSTEDNIIIDSLELYLKLKNEGCKFVGQSYLFWEFVYALKVLNPKYWMLENVANMKQEYKDIITKALGVKPILINSSLVSCQNRERLYWTNIPDIELPEDKNIYFNDIYQKDLSDEELKIVLVSERGLNKFKKAETITNPRVRIFDSTSKKPKKLQAILKTQYKKATDSLVVKTEYGFRYITRTEAEISQTVPIGYTKAATYNESVGMLGNGWTIDVIVHILSHMIWI
jgi:site-specific DNA-cytosine methylase